MQWTISQWIKHFNDLYGANNRARGIDHALLRLIEEMHEAEGAHLFDCTRNLRMSLSERRLNVAREFADVLAWIFSIAGMLELDLEKAIIQRYGGVCERCRKRPCDCGSPLLYDRRANPIRDEVAESRVLE